MTTRSIDPFDDLDLDLDPPEATEEDLCEDQPDDPLSCSAPSS